MEFKTYKTNIDINLYVLYTMCECALFLNYPTYIQDKIKSLIFELDNILFPFLNDFDNYDIVDQKFMCSTILKSNNTNNLSIKNNN